MEKYTEWMTYKQGMNNTEVTEKFIQKMSDFLYDGVIKMKVAEIEGAYDERLDRYNINMAVTLYKAFIDPTADLSIKPTEEQCKNVATIVELITEVWKHQVREFTLRVIDKMILSKLSKYDDNSYQNQRELINELNELLDQYTNKDSDKFNCDEIGCILNLIYESANSTSYSLINEAYIRDASKPDVVS